MDTQMKQHNNPFREFCSVLLTWAVVDNDMTKDAVQLGQCLTQKWSTVHSSWELTMPNDLLPHLSQTLQSFWISSKAHNFSFANTQQFCGFQRSAKAWPQQQKTTTTTWAISSKWRWWHSSDKSQKLLLCEFFLEKTALIFRQPAAISAAGLAIVHSCFHENLHAKISLAWKHLLNGSFRDWS